MKCKTYELQPGDLIEDPEGRRHRVVSVVETDTLCHDHIHNVWMIDQYLVHPNNDWEVLERG